MKKAYFKEYGDPRPIDPETGKVNAALSRDAQANEVIYDPLYRSGYSYGMPRYIHVLPSILGSRESELVNLQYFQENAIPAMAVLIAGGSVSETTLEDLEDYFTNQRGRSAQNKILFIEAYGDEEAVSDKDGRIAPPKLELKPLQGERPQDALFQTYDDNNRKKTRSSFRLNPLLLGESDDMTHATADASLQMTEMQVFGPERGKVDTLFNSKILSDPKGRPPKFWKMVSRAPKLTDPDTLANALSGMEAGGAMSPNKIIQIANEIFGLSIKPIEEEWGDFPFAVTTAMLNRGAEIKGFDKLGKMPPPPAPIAPGNGDPPPDEGKTKPKAKPKPTASGKPPKGGDATDSKPRAKRVRLPVEA
jgi:capsid portal protein